MSSPDDAQARTQDRMRACASSRVEATGADPVDPVDPVDLPRLIGLSGRVRAGKDSAAAHLVSRYGYTRVAFADVLRECAYAADPLVGTAMRWAHLHDAIGYEAAKDHSVYGVEFRRVLMRMGTEMGRGVLGCDIWVDATMSRLEPGRRYVVSDVRFPNEAAALTRGGVLWRIERSGLGPAVTHASETALDDWSFDAMVGNDGTLQGLHEALDEALKRTNIPRLDH